MTRKLADSVTAIERLLDQQRSNLPRLRLCARLAIVLTTANRVAPANLGFLNIDLIQHPS
ncbi:MULTISPECIES: hypothetical protein [unclassified Burkholderia]|uniref:hypothetical protein n=1 Tax=unclassified Burkholderia TaxID=2613784 RepID=UPI002AB0F115|nr:MULTISPECIES: hypothetical protein [unclassified Burkholderia]